MLDRSARISWSAPASNGGAPIVRYVIERREWGTIRWQSEATVTTTSHLATGLVNGVIYEYQIAAENSAGRGPFLMVFEVRSPPPSAPTVLPVRPLNGSVSLTWRTWAIPSYIGQPVAVRIERSTPGGTGFAWAGTTTPSAGTFVIKGLVNGTRYYVRVGYLYRNGQYGWSSPQAVVPRTLPSAPRSPFIVGGLNTIGIEWAPPASDGGASIQGYRFQFSRDGRTWTPYTLYGTNGTPYRSTWAILRSDPWRGGWVTIGRRLWVRVAAVNAAGTGPYTVLGSAVPITYPGYPTNVRATPTSGGAAVSWTPPTTNGFSPLAPYEIQVRRRGSTTWTTVGQTTSTRFQVTGLANGARYCVRVIAWNWGGLGSTSLRVGFTAGSWAYYDPQGWTCY